MLAGKLDALFYHRHPRKVRKDGTVSFEGHSFEVPYELSGQTIVLVVNPHTGQPLVIESKAGKPLGEIAPLDAVANNQRRRCRPDPENLTPATASTDSTVELAYAQYNDVLKPTASTQED